MKKHLFLIAAAIMAVSCGSSTNSNEQNDSTTDNQMLEETPKPKALDNKPLKVKHFYDSLGFTVKETPMFSVISVDFPVEGSQKLIDVIASWELYDSTYDKNASVETLLRKYNQSNIDDFKSTLQEFEDNNAEVMPYELSHQKTIEKVYENEKIVTFISEISDYQGGTHGMYVFEGKTFSKSDGKIWAYDMFKENSWQNILPYVVKGLREYFNVQTNEQLTEMCNSSSFTYDKGTDVFTINPPEGNPYFSNDSIMFLYSCYEIAPYVCGTPYTSVAVKDIQQYISPSFAELLK